MNLPKIVRRCGEISEAEYRNNPDTTILEQKVRQEALALAEQIGIQSPDIYTYWDLAVVCMFTDYPLYLLGENAPKIRTAEDALCYYPRARYTVIIREKTLSGT